MNNFYKKSVLDNGLRVVTSALDGTRSASVSVLVGVGSRYEEDKEAGISHLIEHMLFRGTKKRPTSSDISMAIEGVGAYSTVAPTKNLPSTGVRCLPSILLWRVMFFLIC